jgi:hypothetical protein
MNIDQLLTAIEKLKETADKAVSYVGAANYRERQLEAQGWVDEAYDAIFHLIPATATSATNQSAAVSEHNPDNLTREQLGEGWRFLSMAEMLQDAQPGDEYWSGGKWWESVLGCEERFFRNRKPAANATYRRRLSPDDRSAKMSPVVPHGVSYGVRPDGSRWLSVADASGQHYQADTDLPEWALKLLTTPDAKEGDKYTATFTAERRADGMETVFRLQDGVKAAMCVVNELRSGQFIADALNAYAGKVSLSRHSAPPPITSSPDREIVALQQVVEAVESLPDGGSRRRVVEAALVLLGEVV